MTLLHHRTGLPVRLHLLLVAVSLGLGACEPAPPAGMVSAADARFLGSNACRDCHEAQYEAWRGSQHHLAMQTATAETVLGDFSGVEFDYYATRTTFLMRDGDFVVRTPDETGEPRDYVVTHTFGVEPLQQYLVDFPGGRKQALPFAWDTRPADIGGQRWYHLYPDEYIAPDDPLHWTGRNFNWNYMCAECHSTNVVLGYELEKDSFSTSFAEISVGCEACHGQGSIHVAQANDEGFDEHYGLAVNLDDRRGSAWIMNMNTGVAVLDATFARQQQPETCGRCHARRTVLAAKYEYGKPLTDTHMPSLLEENLYFADGRILDEVYVFGSFLQSRMYAAGVTCSDCHDPHSARLRTGPDPNAACAQCHLPAKFATEEHTGVTSTSCVDCHMPAKTYMGVDDRRDHSFRVPGTGEDEQHYGAAIAAGRAGSSNPLLVEALANPDYPPIARATILTLLTPITGEAELEAIEDGIDDPDPLVRIAALRTLRGFPAEIRLRAGSHLLRDKVRGVRVEAALTYADVRDLLPLDDARAFASAADEYRQVQLNAASRPEAMAVLGEFESRIGDDQAAGRYFEHAIRLDPEFAAGNHAYGLYLVRSGRHGEALQHIRLAAKLEDDNPRYVYVLGVALNSLGRGDEALAVLEKARGNFPDDFDIAWGLATMLRDSGDIEKARRVVDEMQAQFPDSSDVRALRNALPTR